MASFFVPLFSVLLGAAIAIASSIFIERWRDNRSSLAAALVIRNSLKSVIGNLNTASDDLAVLHVLDSRRLLDPWNAHSAVLARSISVADWQLVALAFSVFDRLCVAAETGMTVDPPLLSAVIPFTTEASEVALAKLESLFSFPRTEIPKNTAEGLDRISAMSPELANALKTEIGTPPSSEA